jgi:NAD+ diphosphatase
MNIKMTHPSRIFRFCPKCGSADFVFSGDRSFLCGNCGFHFYINSAAAVAALIFNEKGELLVTRRGVNPDIGKLDLPGGFIDPDESAEEALGRELREELGIEIKSFRFLASRANRYLYSGVTIFTTDFAFHVQPVTMVNMIAGDDIEAFVWIDPANIDPEDIPAPSIRYFIKTLATHEQSAL